MYSQIVSGSIMDSKNLKRPKTECKNIFQPEKRQGEHQRSLLSLIFCNAVWELLASGKVPKKVVSRPLLFWKIGKTLIDDFLPNIFRKFPPE